MLHRPAGGHRAGRRPIGRRSLGAVVAIAVLAGACGDDPAPELVARTFPAGEAVAVSDLAGRPVLLAGWATWCVPCERELPALSAFAADHADDDLVIVAVDVDTTAVDDAGVVAMLERLDVDLTVWRDVDAALLERYGGFAMPFSVLLDADGRVARTWNGGLDVDDHEFLDAVRAVGGIG